MFFLNVFSANQLCVSRCCQSVATTEKVERSSKVQTSHHNLRGHLVIWQKWRALHLHVTANVSNPPPTGLALGWRRHEVSSPLNVKRVEVTHLLVVELGDSGRSNLSLSQSLWWNVPAVKLMTVSSSMVTWFGVHWHSDSTDRLISTMGGFFFLGAQKNDASFKSTEHWSKLLLEVVGRIRASLIMMMKIRSSSPWVGP